MSWISNLRQKAVEELERPVEDNALDRIIVEKGQHPEVSKVYEARWVWYHTILAAELFLIIILLIAILAKI